MVCNCFIYLNKPPTMIKGVQAQRELFKKIKSERPNINLVDELAGILSISNAGVYRRMNAETLLTIDDLIKIGEYYEKSPNEMLGYEIKIDFVTL